MDRFNHLTACKEKKRNKLYLHARKSKDPDVKIHYKRFRAHVQKVLRDAYWKYVSNIFTFENDSSDPNTPKSKKIKRFWSFVKSLKKDAFGIASLRENRTRQFQSAFTREGNSDPPSKGASPFSPMGDITVDLPGHVAQSVTCLATDASLTADPGVASSIPSRSHTFVEIDHEIISTVILLLQLNHSWRVVVSYKRKYVHEVLVNCLPRKKCG